MGEKEPLWTIIGGGTALVQAVLQLLISFNVPINSAQSGAITAVATILLTWYARNKVTPMATLPAGTAEKIANAKAATSVLLIVALGLGASSCTSLGGTKRTAAISVVSADAVLSAVQDTEMGLVCGRPAAPAAPLCVPLDRHKEISGHLADAFKYERQVAQLVKALPDGASSPDVVSLIARIRELVARVVALIPDSSARRALVASLGGA